MKILSPSHSVRQNFQDPWKISCKILQDKALFLQKNARFLQEISVSSKNLEKNFWFNKIRARYVWFLEHFYFFMKPFEEANTFLSFVFPSAKM